MALFNIGKRPVKFDNGTDASPPTAGFFYLRIVIESGTMTHNGADYSAGEVLLLEAPQGRTLPKLVTSGGATYTWHGMR